MNRRELFAAFGLTAFAGTKAKASSETMPSIPYTPGKIRLREPPDFIDLSSVTNSRIGRYKKYEKMLEENPKIHDEIMKRSAEIASEIYSELKLEIHWLNKVHDNPNRKLFGLYKVSHLIASTAIYGDLFVELVIDPEDKYPRPLTYMPLPCDSVYRIETINGDLIEFQQSKEGPDYQAVARCPIDKATDADFCDATAIRFRPEQIVHIRAAGFAKGHYPYGVSAIRTGKVEMGFAFEHSVKEGVRELVGRFD